MTPEAWALIGVVVGALLGGGAQILAGVLQGGRDKKREQRGATRDLYIDSLRFVADYKRTIQHAMVERWVWNGRLATGDATHDSWRRAIEPTEVKVSEVFDEAERRALILRATADAEVSRAFDSVTEAFYDPKEHAIKVYLEDEAAERWARLRAAEATLTTAVKAALS